MNCPFPKLYNTPSYLSGDPLMKFSFSFLNVREVRWLSDSHLMAYPDTLHFQQLCELVEPSMEAVGEPHQMIICRTGSGSTYWSSWRTRPAFADSGTVSSFSRCTKIASCGKSLSGCCRSARSLKTCTSLHSVLSLMHCSTRNWPCSVSEAWWNRSWTCPSTVRIPRNWIARCSGYLLCKSASHLSRPRRWGGVGSTLPFTFW